MVKAGVRINITVRMKARFVWSGNKPVSEDTGNHGKHMPSVGPEESRAESHSVRLSLCHSAEFSLEAP